jgi:hypothetical protein
VSLDARARFATVSRPASAAIEDGPPPKYEPTKNGDGRQHRRNWVTEE